MDRIGDAGPFKMASIGIGERTGARADGGERHREDNASTGENAFGKLSDLLDLRRRSGCGDRGALVPMGARVRGEKRFPSRSTATTGGGERGEAEPTVFTTNSSKTSGA